MSNPWRHLGEDLKSSFSGMPGLTTIPGVTQVKVRACSARELLDQTMSLPQEAFQWHMLSNDPLYERYSDEQRREIIALAAGVGQKYADEVLALGGDLDDVLGHYDIAYDEQSKPLSADRVVFAQYVEPNAVTVFTDTLDKYQRYSECQDNEHDMSRDAVREVLIAHELFHYLEHRDERSIVTKNYKTTTHRAGPLRLRSRVAAMSEIAAMSFAKGWLGLDYSPNVYDVLLVRLYEPDAATMILDNIREVYQDNNPQAIKAV